MTTATRPSLRTNLDHAMLAVAAQTDDRDAIALFLDVSRQAAYCQVQDREAFLRMESRMRVSPATKEAILRLGPTLPHLWPIPRGHVPQLPPGLLLSLVALNTRSNPTGRA